MTGVEFLEEAMQLYPDARRVLLTAYADTEVAIRAINAARIHYYLQKPWDPPEQQLYPILDDQLSDWNAGYRPPFEGIQVVGYRWSPDAHRVKEFLSRNLIPFQWLDLESEAKAKQLVGEAEIRPSTSAGASPGNPALPLVVLPDGSRLENPDVGSLARQIGFKTRPERDSYDLLVVGAGPSGLAAAVYGASEGLRTALIEREAPGGQAGQSSRIENYLGFPAGLSGRDLARRAVDQARKFGAEILTPQEALGVRTQDSYHILRVSDCDISCRALLIASGVSYRTLDVPGIQRLTGAGVYYGSASTEAVSCRDQCVFVVGGGNSAGQAAMHLARFASQVTLLVREDSLERHMSQYLVDEIRKQESISVRLRTQVVGVRGNDHLEAIKIAESPDGEREVLQATALFIFIGAAPRTGWLEGVVERDPKGFILSGPDLIRDGRRPDQWKLERDPYLLETSVPGIFVAGDVRFGSVKRVATGVGEGAVAVSLIHQYIGGS
jgi:thioredoxin reductase (NADPH)